MKLPIILGALLLSTTPVHAFETVEEIVEPCHSSDETWDACQATGFFRASVSSFTVLCRLKETGDITQKGFTEEVRKLGEIEEEYEKVAWNTAVKIVQVTYPNCPVKPLH